MATFAILPSVPRGKARKEGCSFLKKEPKKAFAQARFDRRETPAQPETDKSFLLLFFKKEESSFYRPVP
jgi:hypothetical protein